MKTWNSCKRILPVLILTLALSACNTVAPVRFEPKQASFDGNQQNSGLTLVDHQWHLSAKAEARYIALVNDYGYKFTPHLTADAGLTALPDGSFIIDAEHLEKFVTMSRWRLRGVK